MSKETDQKFSYNAAKIVPGYLIALVICASTFVMGDWRSTYMQFFRSPPGVYLMYMCGFVIAAGLLRYLPEFLMSLSKHSVVVVGADHIKVRYVKDRVYNFEGSDMATIQHSISNDYLLLHSKQAGTSRISLAALNDSPILLRILREKFDIVTIR